MKGKWAPRLCSFGVWPSFTFTFTFLLWRLVKNFQTLGCRTFESCVMLWARGQQRILPHIRDSILTNGVRNHNPWLWWYRSIQAAAAAAQLQSPPMSNPLTSVWYWMLDGRPTTIVYHKPKKEVWCNGYLLDTYVRTPTLSVHVVPR